MASLGYPGLLAPLIGPDGQTNPEWQRFFLQLAQSVASSSDSISGELDLITAAIGAMLFRGGSAWQGLSLGAPNTVLIAGGTAPLWGFLGGAEFSPAGANLVFAGPNGGVSQQPTFRSLVNTDIAGITLSGTNFAAQAPNVFFGGPTSGLNANPSFRRLVSADVPTLSGGNFANQAANTFFAGPSSGGAATASFRGLASADLNSVAGQIPGTTTNDDAGVGDVGEYRSAVGTAAAMTSNTPTDLISLSLTAGDWNVWGSLTTTPAAGTTTSLQRAWIYTASATDPGPPNGGAYLLNQAAIGAALAEVTPIGMMRIKVPNGTTTTVYLSTTIVFAVSTLGATGFIGARRAR